jgi:hypothetical protein
MSVSEALRLLLTEVAAELELAALMEHEGEEGLYWDICVSEQRLIEAFLDEESGKLTLSTDLGIPGEEDAARVHRILLQYNYLWRETSGVRMALEEPSGMVVMLYDFNASAINRELLGNIIQNFSAAAEAWTALLSQPRAASSAKEKEDLSALELANSALFVRV